MASDEKTTRKNRYGGKRKEINKNDKNSLRQRKKKWGKR